MTEHDSFQKLEEKIAKAVEVFKHTQAEKRALEQEVEKLRAGAKDRSKQSEAQERELIALRREREEVRGRIEKLLDQIDALTKPDDAG
ncbi:MAG TPA: hypothetical protein VGW33_11845 [Terriglobia bacterium]|nr:hypothetical protein [Terriglobia bacterium]